MQLATGKFTSPKDESIFSCDKLGIDMNIPPSLTKGHSGQNTA